MKKLVVHFRLQRCLHLLFKNGRHFVWPGVLASYRLQFLISLNVALSIFTSQGSDVYIILLIAIRQRAATEKSFESNATKISHLQCGDTRSSNVLDCRNSGWVIIHIHTSHVTVTRRAPKYSLATSSIGNIFVFRAKQTFLSPVRVLATGCSLLQYTCSRSAVSSASASTFQRTQSLLNSFFIFSACVTENVEMWTPW